ncbi:MAG: SWIM zinc finger family protein [Clostridiales bacterium]|nr:SWIM zinc finger family protein [Clostridiales bacterium]
MNITKDYIKSISVNEAAVKNGAGLVNKRSYSNLTTDKDQRFFSGECAGSGKNPYFCSVDFIDENAPAFRCTCPSRQIPCKHVMGLLWARAEGQPFALADVPESIVAKREKKEVRAAKAVEKAARAENEEQADLKEKSDAWKKSAVKKIDAQLTGIEEAEKMLRGIVQAGLASMDAKSVTSYSGIVKNLDSYFIPGIQNEIKDLLGQAQRPGAAEKLCQIQVLLSKAKAYLVSKKERPDMLDIESEIEELIGYAWKLQELAQRGLVEENARLVELCFHVRREEDKKQYVDEGFHISLNSGKIFRTRNYRPFKAAKHIKEQDSSFSALSVPKLYVYPSKSANPRVRWEDSVLNSFEEVQAEDCRLIKAHGHADYAEVIKTVKGQLKNLLLSPHPAVLVRVEKLLRIAERSGAEGGEKYVAYDSSGNAIFLKQSKYFRDSFVFMLDLLTKEDAEGCAMLLLFENDAQAGRLFAQPLSVVTDDKIIRLVY